MADNNKKTEKNKAITKMPEQRIQPINPNIVRIAKTGGILCLITAVAALLLGVVNTFTAPVIAKNTAEKTEAAMKRVMQTADSFEKVEFISDEDTSDVKEIYIGKKDGAATGVCVVVSPNGYGGAINMMVGVDCDMRVTGVDIIEQSETAGLGAKVLEDSFRNQYKGKSVINKVVKIDAKENEINAISGATITSKAVTKGVNEAISAAEKQLKIGSGEDNL